MRMNRGCTFATLVALAVSQGFQAPITRADNPVPRAALVTFTKWVTGMPGLPGLIANMEGVVGGDTGEGKFTGEVLKWDTSREVTEIVAFYHLVGSEHAFSALVHVQQPKTSSQGSILGVVTEGWLKGRALRGHYTQFDVGPNPHGANLPIPYFEVTLNIEQDSPEPEPILYATAGAGGALVRIDVGARKVTEVGKTGVPFALAIAINAQGQAFSVTDSHPAYPGSPRLARVDLTTGVATPFGPVLGGEEFMGLGFAPDGTLYGVNAMSGTPDAGSLYKFNPTTGEATKVGVTGGCFEIMDLAWHPDGRMFGAVNDSLYRVNPTTGQATLVTKLQGVSAVMGLVIDSRGNFYVSEIVTNSPLLRADPVTGATTKLFDTGVDFIHGLDLAPVPRLATAQTGNQLALSWPAWTAGYDLESTEAIDSPRVWARWPGAPTVVGSRNTMAAEAVGPARFFRLIRR